ncbi:MAG: DUF3641 domain-containing protein, partial [Chryseobacterium sp.]
MFISGFIYRIITDCPTTGKFKVYIGSTMQSLSMRLSQHESMFKKYQETGKRYCSSYEVLKADWYEICLEESLHIDNLNDLLKAERKAYDKYRNHGDYILVNTNCPARNVKEYYQSAIGKASIKRYHQTQKGKEALSRANKKYYDLPEFFRDNHIEVVSSLPFYSKDRTDRQRGDGVFEQSIEALKMLNAVGYGKEGTGLQLNLVYNPAGAFLPGSQEALEKEFKTALKKDFDIEFNQLFAITNLPVSRYLDYLLQSGNYEKYMEKLIASFNPVA